MVFIYFGTPCIWPRIVSLAHLHDKDLRFPAVLTSACIFLLFFFAVSFHTYFLEFNNKKFYFLGMHKT